MSSDLETLSRHAAGSALRPSVQIEDLGRWRRRLQLVFAPETVRRERQRLLREYARRIRMPGFRPGKTPLEVVRKRFAGEVERDLLRTLLEGGFREALDERGLSPISPPVLQTHELDPADDTLRATLEVDVRPEIALPRTGGFQVERPRTEVGADAVDRVLQRLREERADLTRVERPAARGDVVLADVEALGDNAAPEAPRRVQVLLGGDQSPPELEQQLEGASGGDELEVEIGEGRWRVAVREVQERTLPALDDAFAATASRATTLAELREQITENLRVESAAHAERAVRDQLIEALAEANRVEIPESMIKRYVERMLHPEGEGSAGGGTSAGRRHAPSARSSGRHREISTSRGEPGGESTAAVESTGAGGEEDRAAEIARLLRPSAERSLRRLLIVEALAKERDLEPSEEEVDAYLRERADPSSESTDPVREARRSLERTGRMEELRFHLRSEKVFEYLKSQSAINEPSR